MPDQSADQHPRFGATEQRMINEVLSDVSLVGTSSSRDAGTRFAVVLGIFTLLGGVGTVRFFLEGTLDGTNWFSLSSTFGATDLSGTGTVVLNAAADSLVDIQRFDQLRIRAAVVAGAPVFTLQGIVTGIAYDAEKFDLSETFLRAGALPVSQEGDLFPRPSGTLFANGQVTATGVVLGGLAGINVSLQGTPDGGENWVTLGTVSVVANSSQLLEVGGETFFSCGAYDNLRWIVEDDGGAGGATAFTIVAHLGLDSGDWNQVDASGSGSGVDPSEVFVIAVFGAPTAEVLDTRTVGFQLVDSDGAPIAEIRKVELILYDTSLAGTLDLSMNATFTAVNTGAAISGVGTNRLAMVTDASGQGDVSVLDAATETVYVTLVNPTGPNTIAQVVVKADQVPLPFA